MELREQLERTHARLEQLEQSLATGAEGPDLAARSSRRRPGSRNLRRCSPRPPPSATRGSARSPCATSASRPSLPRPTRRPSSRSTCARSSRACAPSWSRSPASASRSNASYPGIWRTPTPSWRRSSAQSRTSISAPTKRAHSWPSCDRSLAICAPRAAALPPAARRRAALARCNRGRRAAHGPRRAGRRCSAHPFHPRVRRLG